MKAAVLFFFAFLGLYTGASAIDIPLNLIAEPTVEVYKEVDGRELKLYIFNPANHKTRANTPAVVCIHGGGWMGGDPSLFFPHARYFAARGLVAFSVQYRLTSAEGVTVGDCIEDCKSAFRFIRLNAERFGVDPARLAVLGDSAGGHLAACMGVMDEFEAPKEDRSISSFANAMILYNPVVDSTVPELSKYVPDRPLKGLPGLSRDEIIRRISPLFRVKPGQSPTLIMHGLADTNVPPDQSRRFAKAMQDAGNRCELVLLPKTNHAFVIVHYTAPDAVVVSSIRRADEFLRSLGYVKGKPTLVTPKK